MRGAFSGEVATTTLADIGVWIGYAQIGKDPEYAIIQAIASINPHSAVSTRRIVDFLVKRA
jgi:hypothetical protein